eukprot:TRINITY_DN22691_c0_g1_i1.p1 TRINITY_DN22691_c0_g1~~TRINITY_DN22691_c0_g1_i1.p1  ORF type:complete len:101 (-),score=13.71 TRINITY_DN22691_c0_g1_i1:11-313(-)
MATFTNCAALDRLWTAGFISLSTLKSLIRSDRAAPDGVTTPNTDPDTHHEPPPLPARLTTGSTVSALRRRCHQRDHTTSCLLYTSPSPRDRTRSRMPSSA